MSVARIDQPRTALLVDILPAFALRADARRKTWIARFLASLEETRRQEAVRVIHQYVHLLDDKKQG